MSDQLEQLKSERTSARKEAFEHARSIVGYKTVLLVVAVAAALGITLYFIQKYGEPPAPAASAEAAAQAQAPANPSLRETRRKLIALEKEIELLKAELEPDAKPKGVLDHFESAIDGAISNWALLSFLAAVATALYVKMRFKIDYFESYRDLSSKKALSDFYRQLGDRMLIYGEWEASEAAYRNSLEINPTNFQAAYGVTKASIFQPMKGQQFYAPEVADAKLDHLLRNAERTRQSRAQLLFLKGVNRRSQNDIEEARRCYREAIEMDAAFVGSYLELGYLAMGEGDVAEAARHFKEALDLDPSYALANNNLGYCYLVTLRFGEAIKCFETAQKAAATLLTSINLGKAYRFAGDSARAAAWHKHALAVMGQRGIAKERYGGGDWIYNFMPLNKEDTDSPRRCVRASATEQKNALLLFALGLDYAALDDFTHAAKHTTQGCALDKIGEFREFFVNEIDATLAWTPLSSDAKTWLQQKRKDCLPVARV